MDFLIAARFFQALGACAGPVISRAIVRDLFEPKEAVQVFSLLVLVMGVSPVLAPIAGSQMLGFFDWRDIFWVIAVIGVLGLAGTLIRLRETHLKERAALSLGGVLSVYGLLLRDRAFVGYVVTGGMAMAGMFAYIVGSPYVFIDYFQVTPGRFGFIFGLNALGLVLAAQLNARLVRRFASDTIVQKVLVVQVLTGLTLFAGTWSGLLQFYGIAVLLFVYVSSVGCLFPNITALAMAPHGARAGSASAMIGVMQFALAACSATLIGAIPSGNALPIAALIGGCAVSAAAIYWLMVPTSR
jgi:DHA1 family bicyclomycin/chloramphenicol resistance-like MFS transporter